MSNLKRKDHPTDGHADQPKRKNHKRSKKDRMPSIAELLDRPWCYYCKSTPPCVSARHD